jgi:hypothetical protein
MEKTEKPTRRATQPIKVYCLPEEKRLIKSHAEAAGLTASNFLLKLGQGYKVSSLLDNKQIEELARINGDLGRLGGLLKLWLTDDTRTSHFGGDNIRAILSKIEGSQDEIQRVMKKVLLPKASK